MGIDELLINAIHEDIGEGDHTSLACIPENAEKTAILLIKEEGILAGVEIAKKVFHLIDKNLKIDIFIEDGAKIKKGDIAFNIKGRAQSILSAERLALNFMQRMSGIATHTALLVGELEGLHTKLLDTRKTTPNFRIFEKMAVKIGGGENHRFGLYDMIMIKDNHIDYAGGIKEAITTCKSYLATNNLRLKIEVEARSLEEVEAILKYGVDRIMLDNFDCSELRKAVVLIDKKAETEASGGITKETIRKYGETGVDYISVGALTHQIKSLDMSLKAMG